LLLIWRQNDNCRVADRKPKLLFFKGKVVVPRGGFEPPTRGFSVRCSTN
jgi:hypothetical protein